MIEKKLSMGIAMGLLCLAQIVACGDNGKPGEDANEDITGEDTGGEEEVNPCTGLNCTGTIPYCCEGQCRECCEDIHCNDAVECTLDSCNAGTCVHQPVADRTTCSGGICCGGECRTGGECCSSDDCVEGCKGTSTSCGEFTSETECTSQSGCTWLGPGSCTGTPNCYQYSTSQGLCITCAACEWIGSTCRSHPCEALTDGLDCTACNCTWTPGGCTGTHEPCSSSPNEDLCHGQLDCYWSACVQYVCT